MYPHKCTLNYIKLPYYIVIGNKKINKAAKVLATCLSNGQDQDLFRNVFYENIYGTTKFEFYKFTSIKESSAF